MSPEQIVKFNELNEKLYSERITAGEISLLVADGQCEAADPIAATHEQTLESLLGQYQRLLESVRS